MTEFDLRYHALFNRSNDAIFLIDLDQIFRAVNQKTTELLGYGPDELIGMSIRDIVVPEEYRLSQARAQALLAGEILPVYERTFVRKDGTRVVGEISASMVHDMHGKPQFIQSIVRDVTEKRAAEKALWESEHRYRALFNQTNDGITLMHLDGVVFDANPRAAEILGYTVEEMVGHRIDEFSGAEETRLSMNVVKKINAGEALPIYERNLRKKDGTLVPVEINVTLVSDRDGNPVYIQSITRDISSRKQVEKKLEHLSTHDQLTGLPNRTLLFDRLGSSISRCKRYDRKFLVFFIDLDGFKTVNDTYGHAAGDSVLVAVADRLRECVRESDTVARMSGDEFILILEEIVDIDYTRIIAQRVLNIISRPYRLDNREVHITASIGVSVFPNDGEDAEALVSSADRAMYASKGIGKNRYTLSGENEE